MVVGAYEDKNINNRVLGRLKVKIVLSGEVSDLKVLGLFFAIRHKPATKFLDGQLELDSGGYVVTKPGTPQTNVLGVFSVGDVQDKNYMQAVTATNTGLSIFSTSPLHHLNFNFGTSTSAALLFFHFIWDYMFCAGNKVYLFPFLFLAGSKLCLSRLYLSISISISIYIYI